MEPLNDTEVRELLRKWRAPDAPARLESRIFGPRYRRSRWKWLLTGSIRIPVPVGILAAIAIAWILFQIKQPSQLSPDAVSLSNFQPVKELKPRIIRNSYDDQ